MNKINNIEYNNDYIEIKMSDKKAYKIANNNYVRSLLHKAINSNKKINKDIRYYEKCADLCMYPIWIAISFLGYAIATNFVALDLIMILCGGMAGVSLVGTGVFKAVSKKLKNEANNNEYFNKIYQYAKDGSKVDNKVQGQTKQNINSIPSPKKQNEKINFKQMDLNNSSYRLSSSQIIQDEVISKRKR